MKNGTEIIGRNPGFVECLRLAEKAASTDRSILITGETGTGKELFVRLIHSKSRFAAGVLVPVNCGCLNGDLGQSDLFGHGEEFPMASEVLSRDFEDFHTFHRFLNQRSKLRLIWARWQALAALAQQETEPRAHPADQPGSPVPRAIAHLCRDGRKLLEAA